MLPPFTGRVTDIQRLSNLVNVIFYNLRGERKASLRSIFQISGHTENENLKDFGFIFLNLF